MAIGEHKNKSPYHGVWGSCLVMIAIPIGLYFLFRGMFTALRANPTAELNEATARAVGFGVGVLFHLSLGIAGLLEDPFHVVIARVADFFDNCKISFKFACSCHADQVREGGVVFWIFFVIIVTNFCVFWSGLKIVLAQLL